MSLALERASVIRKGRAILDTASFELLPGRFSAICGPNGAGKSTALSLLTGAERPDRGAARLDGQEIRSLPQAELARRRAVVAQQHRLTFPFLVHEVVAMGRAPHQGRSAPEDDAAITTAAMEAMELLPLAERNYLTLSGGERQRAMIARALAQVWNAPEVGHRWLVLDEPTAALDLKYQLSLMRLLKRLAGEDWGIVAVLHDLPLVERFTDHVVVMKDGGVFAQGVPGEVLTPQGIAEVYDLDEPYELV